MKKQGTTPTAGVLVNGDSGNDVGMFKVRAGMGPICFVPFSRPE
jgi:hydroxymethylpyrimidine pyrophosphatase-like HAD family hydrolase